MSLEIDLTWIQTILRNTSDSDVLFIFEYCEGAHDGMDPLPSPGSSTWENYPEHKVWTISAGPGSIWITNDGRDFTRRLVANLRADRGPTTVLDRFQAMQKAVKFNMGADHHAPLDIKQQMPYGDIILQPQGETESVNGADADEEEVRGDTNSQKNAASDNMLSAMEPPIVAADSCYGLLLR